MLEETKVPGNAVTLLQNGDEIFPAMLEAIREAKHSICFETYVYWSGDIAIAFAEALEEAAKRGVTVLVILDWYGSMKMKRGLFDEMKEAGVQVEYFRPLRWFNFRRANHRTHRKLLIADGRIGFTGGVGVADEWTGNAQDKDHWRDNHYRFEGPIVKSMQTIFFANWSACGHDPPSSDDPHFFPELEPADDVTTASFFSSPLHDDHGILNLFESAITQARTRLWIASAYFMPGEGLVAKLKEARQRGVSVRVLMSGKHIDQDVVRQASRYFWGELLEAGIDLYEYEPTLMHVKMLIVDEAWVSVGSANFDARSCRLNDEAVINLYGADATAEHADIFEKDLQRARKIEMETWRQRPLWTKLTDAFASLFRRQL